MGQKLCDIPFHVFFSFEKMGIQISLFENTEMGVEEIERKEMDISSLLSLVTLKARNSTRRQAFLSLQYELS